MSDSKLNNDKAPITPDEHGYTTDPVLTDQALSWLWTARDTVTVGDVRQWLREKARNMEAHRTSEDVLGLVRQPDETCPIMDDIKSDIQRLGGSDWPAIHEVWAKVERLRKEVESLRSWGQDWKDQALMLHQNYGTDEWRQIQEARDRRAAERDERRED